MSQTQRKLTSLFLLLFVALSFSFGQEGGKTFGGSQNEQGYAFTILSDGNYAVVGRTRSEGAGANDLWVLKIDAHAGTLIWSRTFGSETLEQGHWVEATPDGGMVVLGFSNGLPDGGGRFDYLLLKLDANGNEEWSKLYGGKNREIGFCVHEAYGAGYVLVGYSKTGNIRGDIRVYRVDGGGELVWDSLYQSPYVDYGHQISKTSDGGYMIIGSESGFYYPSSLDHAKDNADLFLIKIDSSGAEMWRKVYGGRRHDLGRAFHQAPGGGWYLFGSTQSEGAGSFDQFLIRINEDGDSLWSRTYGGAEWDYGTSIDVDPDGDLYLLGTTNSLGNTGSPDILLQKTDPQGGLIWALTLGGTESDYGYQVRVLPEGGCMLVGATRSFGNGEQDVYIVKVSTNGRVEFFIDEPIVRDAVVYPNPVSNGSIVDPGSILGLTSFEWRVYDAAGRLIIREDVGGGQTTSVSNDKLPSGIYLYEIRVGDTKRLGGKLLVE
jgi:hypothetical protein